MKILPRADKMAADQKISPMSAGTKSRPPILFPYSCWKGSSIVTYPRERIGFAKKRPPDAQGGKPENKCKRSLFVFQISESM